MRLYILVDMCDSSWNEIQFPCPHICPLPNPLKDFLRLQFGMLIKYMLQAAIITTSLSFHNTHTHIYLLYSYFWLPQIENAFYCEPRGNGKNFYYVSLKIDFRARLYGQTRLPCFQLSHGVPLGTHNRKLTEFRVTLLLVTCLCSEEQCSL